MAKEESKEQKKFTSRQVLIEFVTKYPRTPTRTLAKNFMEIYPDLYSNVESCRVGIRRIRGAKGNKNAKHKSEAPIPELESSVKDREANPFNVPSSNLNDFKPYVLPSKYKNILILSDIHFPYHDPTAINAALMYGETKEVDCIILNGDIVDAYQLSYWDKDPRNRSFKEEVDILKTFLNNLNKYFPNCKIIYKEGNHEERYFKYLIGKAPQLVGFECFDIESLLGLDDFGIDLVKDKRFINIDNYTVVHGHEFGRSMFNPVNAARGYYLRARHNLVGGHYHATSEHNEPDVRGEELSCYSSGHLSDPHPKYKPINKWNQGFIRMVRNGRNDIRVYNIKIRNGEII